MRSGQASLEFVLVAAFLLGLITVLMPTANNLVDQVSSMDDLVVTKGSLASLGSSINYVYISGNGSSMHQDIYLPKTMNCFVANKPTCTMKTCKEWASNNQNTYCRSMENFTVTLNNTYPGINVKYDCEGRTGWHSADISSNGTNVTVTCGS